VLSTDTELPVVTQTPTITPSVQPDSLDLQTKLDIPVGPDLLQPLDVITQLLVNNVGNNVQVLSVSDVLPPVQEPGGNLELSRVLHDGNDSLELIGVELSGTNQHNPFSHGPSTTSRRVRLTAC
jgi:hypothetical protein